MNTAYKQDYENIAKMFCESSIRYIHLSIAKWELLNEELPEPDEKDADKDDGKEDDKSAVKGALLSRIFEGLLTVIVDGIASGLSLEFIDHVKGQLFYEVSLILQLGIKKDLNLDWDVGTILSRLQKLCQIY